MFFFSVAMLLEQNSPFCIFTVTSFVAVGSVTDSNLRADILHSLRCQPKPGSRKTLPSKLSVSLKGHTKAINCVDWSPTHGQ